MIPAFRSWAVNQIDSLRYAVILTETARWLGGLQACVIWSNLWSHGPAFPNFATAQCGLSANHGNGGDLCCFYRITSFRG
jgi:hypothetical protein